jgi:predicted transcriptional regulator of viral defense system
MVINDVNIPFDYTFLISRLKYYSSPRDKITRLLGKGEIIRIRKGLYISRLINNPHLLEILAEMIYGPSYISLEYALAYYQMIPEQVKTVTSITTQKPKTYNTPAGTFRYQHIKPNLFHLGLDYVKTDNGAFRIATKEKALTDLVYYRYTNVNEQTMSEFLLDDMRMESEELVKLNLKAIHTLAGAYNKTSICQLIRFLQEIRL